METEIVCAADADANPEETDIDKFHVFTKE